MTYQSQALPDWRRAPHPARSPAFGWLPTHAAELARIRRDLKHLDQLPDYLLDDVGLTRGDVIAAKHKGSFF